MAARIFTVTLTVAMLDYTEHGTDPTISAVDGIMNSLSDIPDINVLDWNEQEMAIIPKDMLDNVLPFVDEEGDPYYTPSDLTQTIKPVAARQPDGDDSEGSA